MSTCYKCGKEIPFGAECDPPCGGPDQEAEERMRTRFAASLERFEKMQVEIDWDTIKTFEDLRELVAYFGQQMGMTITRGTPAYHKLRRFLKEKNQND